MIRRPPRSTPLYSSAASDVYKRQALGCVRCACCESGRGCPRGIASTDPELMMLMGLEWATQRLINLMHAWRERMVELMVRLGISSVKALRGRSDLLTYAQTEDAL